MSRPLSKSAGAGTGFLKPVRARPIQELPMMMSKRKTMSGANAAGNEPVANSWCPEVVLLFAVISADVEIAGGKSVLSGPASGGTELTERDFWATGRPTEDRQLFFKKGAIGIHVFVQSNSLKFGAWLISLLSNKEGAPKGILVASNSCPRSFFHDPDHNDAYLPTWATSPAEQKQGESPATVPHGRCYFRRALLD